MSARRFGEVRSQPTLRGLLALSEGRDLSPAQRDEILRRIPGFVERAQLAWVVMHPSRTSPALRAFALEAFQLEYVAEDGDAVLYRPRVPTAPAPLPLP